MIKSEQAIKKLAELYFSQDLKENLLEGIIKTADLQIRLDTFLYGFGARTKSALEGQIPKTKSKLGKDAWNELGRKFSLEAGIYAENLNEISFEFPQFLIQKKVADKFIEVCKLEILTLKVLRSELPIRLTMQQLLNKIENENKIVMQPHVQMMQTKLNIISEELDADDKQLILWNQGGVVQVEVLTQQENRTLRFILDNSDTHLISNNDSDEKSVASFFIKAIANNWLV
ncbi:MAG: hypothetical protein WA160_04420 [Pseudobdellovibrio sp.]